MSKLPQRRKIKQKSKRYKTYVLESKEHYESIMNKYGMPPKARPPRLPLDVIERLAEENSFTPEQWNGSHGKADA